MRYRLAVLVPALICALVCVGRGQTLVDLRTQAKSVDFSAANATKPFKSGASLPALCSVGEAFFQSTAPAGSNIYACTSLNAWSLQAGATSLSGDVSGGLGANTVSRIQGRSVSATAPVNGQALVWNNLSASWGPQAIGGAINSLNGLTGTLTLASGSGLLPPSTAGSTITLALDSAYALTHGLAQYMSPWLFAATTYNARLNEYTGVMTPSPAAFVDGSGRPLTVLFGPNVTNAAGAMLVNIGLGDKRVFKFDGATDPAAGDFKQGSYYLLVYNRTLTVGGVPNTGAFELKTLPGNAGLASGSTAGGDLTGTLPNPTVAKVSGVAYPASPSPHTVPVITAAGTAAYKAIPDCQDNAGNHLNYAQSSDTISCGTSDNGGSAIGAAVYFPWGVNGFGSTAVVVPTGAMSVASYAFLAPSPGMTIRHINFNITTAATSNCGGGSSVCGLVIAIKPAALTSDVCVTTVVVGAGVPNLNTTGVKSVSFASGFGVSGGICTLPAGAYKLLVTSDSATVAWTVWSGPAADGSLMSANIASNDGHTVTGVATGSGATLAIPVNLSATTFTAQAGLIDVMFDGN